MHLLLLYPVVSTVFARASARNVLPGRFELAGRSGVPVMHAALLPNGHVVFVDKLENYTEARLPNGRYAYSTMYDPDTHQLRPLSLISNAFCCGGGFLSDGTLMTMGGNEPLTWLDDSIGDGFDVLRYLSSDKDATVWREYAGVKLSTRRWYASVQTLSDGRVFVAAGSLNGMDLYKNENNNPTYELLDAQGKPQGQSVLMDILVHSQPYYMYPFVHMLKDGDLFVFTDRASQIFDVDQNHVVVNLPPMNGMHRTYPNTGSSVMLPLTRGNNYEAEIMICGGGAEDDSASATDNSCGRIKPRSNRPQWRMTQMPGGGRTMVEGILLLDGTVLWINGARVGCQGFGTASQPALEALIYDPGSDKWTADAKSDIPRLYHSVALMLLDGTILVAGSNPNEMPLVGDQAVRGDPLRAFPTEFRVEKYVPPYLAGERSNRRPENIKISSKVMKIGQAGIVVGFSSRIQPRVVRVMLYHGGFITHAVHMGQVMVEMEQRELRKMKGNASYGVHVDVPNIKLAPGPYVLYVVTDGVPSVGQFVSLTTR